MMANKLKLFNKLLGFLGLPYYQKIESRRSDREKEITKSHRVRRFSLESQSIKRIRFLEHRRTLVVRWFETLFQRLNYSQWICFRF